MNITETFFGYGSLLNEASLKETLPHVKDVRPAYIKGFSREFGVWDPESFSYDSDKVGVYALNIKKSTDKESRVNGILFKVDSSDIPNLLEREDGYIEILAPVYDYRTEERLGYADIFERPKDDNTFLFNSQTQEEYLSLCLSGAKRFGDTFYREFLETTFIGDRSLDKIPELQKFL